MAALAGLGVGLLIVGALIGVGYLIGYSISTPGRIREPGGSGSPTTCADFCAAWQRARADVCSARTDEETARANAETAWNVVVAMLAAAAITLASAIAASLIPFIGPAIAGPLFATHAALLATAILLMGIYDGLAFAVITKRQETADAMNAASAARQRVIDNCPDEAERTRCLATPPPC